MTSLLELSLPATIDCGGGMGLEEEEKALGRAPVPKGESFRKQRRVGCFQDG